MPTVRGRQRLTPIATQLANHRAKIDAWPAGQAWWSGFVEGETARQSFAVQSDHLFGEAARGHATVATTTAPHTR